MLDQTTKLESMCLWVGEKGLSMVCRGLRAENVIEAECRLRRLRRTEDIY